MKGTATAMKLELAGNSRLALCWKISQAETGDVFTFTAHDAPVVDPTDGLTYVPIASGSYSDVSTDLALQADNVNLAGALEAPQPTLDSVRAGDWDYAEVAMFYLCWADPSKGRHLLRYGTLGEISTGLSDYSGELRGLIQWLSQSVGDLTQPACRHRFGSGGYLQGGCNNDGTTDPDDFKVEGTLDDVSADGVDLESSAFVELGPDGQMPSGSFSWGKIRIEDGDNAGRTRDIKVSITGAIQLHLPFPYPLTVGTAFTAWYGCDGLRETCKVRYSNIFNFDGEPFLPGLDKVMQVARA